MSIETQLLIAIVVILLTGLIWDMFVLRLTHHRLEVIEDILIAIAKEQSGGGGDGPGIPKIVSLKKAA